MNQMAGWGIALIAVGAIMGMLHFAGILIGTTLSWVAGLIFVAGIIVAIVGAGRTTTRKTHA